MENLLSTKGFSKDDQGVWKVSKTRQTPGYGDLSSQSITFEHSVFFNEGCVRSENMEEEFIQVTISTKIDGHSQKYVDNCLYEEDFYMFENMLKTLGL